MGQLCGERRYVLKRWPQICGKGLPCLPRDCQGRLPVAWVKYDIYTCWAGGFVEKVVYRMIGDTREYRETHQNMELNACARSIINKKTELNIMVDDIKPHIICITESWANNDITDAELGLETYAMFRKDRMGRRGGRVLLYIKETVPVYEVQVPEEADCNEAILCKLVTGHATVTIGVVYRCPNITKKKKEKIHNAITEVGKGNCITMGDFNHGNTKWDTQQNTGVEDQTFLCLILDNVLTQDVFNPVCLARYRSKYTNRTAADQRKSKYTK